MRSQKWIIIGSMTGCAVLLVVLGFFAFAQALTAQPSDPAAENAQRMLKEGQQTFRFDTFGDEAFWGDTLKLHQAIAGEANGGVGAGVSPNLALKVGLKVDMDALPADLVAKVQAKQVNLDDPAT